MYDFIGDIHGHGDELEELLNKLGYAKSDGAFAHPTRKAFFLGDFIDRGPKIKKTLEIVRSMIGAGHAKSVIANHELNLICFMTKDRTGKYLRPRSDGNIRQIAQTYAQLTQEELEDYAKWFLKLPLWHEEEGFRAVHACWDEEQIRTLHEAMEGDKLDLDVLKERYFKGDSVFEAIEILLKGPEVKLNNHTFTDAGGKIRDRARVAWWDENLLVANKELEGKVTPEEINYPFYPRDEKIVFFGHYWLQSKPPYVCSPSAQCLDFSVAKNGNLVAYRFDGEKQIDPNSFVWVKAG